MSEKNYPSLKEVCESLWTRMPTKLLIGMYESGFVVGCVLGSNTAYERRDWSAQSQPRTGSYKGEDWVPNHQHPSVLGWCLAALNDRYGQAWPVYSEPGPMFSGGWQVWASPRHIISPVDPRDAYAHHYYPTLGLALLETTVQLYRGKPTHWRTASPVL